MSTRVLLVSAVVLLVVLLTGPLGYKAGLVPLEPSLISLLVAVVGGILVAIVALGYIFVAVKHDLPRNRNLIGVALVLGLVPMIVIGPQMGAAREVPAIHDITTDPENPPAFVALLPQRESAPNGFEYGSEAMPAEQLAATTRQAYSDLMPLRSTLSIGDATRKAEVILKSMGLEVVAADPIDGRVEATATTRWFGFKDDVVVRIAEADEGSLIDVRSMSRVGQSDIGVNAKRISEFFSRFEG